MKLKKDSSTKEIRLIPEEVVVRHCDVGDDYDTVILLQGFEGENQVVFLEGNSHDDVDDAVAFAEDVRSSLGLTGPIRIIK